MSRLKLPDIWFLTALLLTAAVGAVLLTSTGAIDADTSRLSYSRHYWQAAFDAISAACGVGLLTYDFQDDYTATGRWILSALGVCGAVLFIAATTHAARRMQTGESRVRVPHPLLAVLGFLVIQALTVGVYLLANKLDQPIENLQRGVAAFSSLGWGSVIGAGDALDGVSAWPLALLAWIGAVGWPVWLLLAPSWHKRFGLNQHDSGAAPLIASLGAYVAFLLLAALLISLIESPRGATASGGPNDQLAGRPFSQRYARSLVQTVSASGAGQPTEDFTGRNVSDGTKCTLAALLVVGGLGGGATGGVHFTLFLWAAAGACAGLGWLGRGRAAPDAARWMHAGMACLLLLIALIVVVAVGMLLLENWTASRYQSLPAFADALLDAASIVAGGNLTSGLTETVTSRNMITGIRRGTNLYQYGMTLLMLAMLAGRVLPLTILRRLADRCEKPRARAVI